MYQIFHAMTRRSFEYAGPIAQLPADIRLALLRSDIEYLEAALKAINREYHSIDGYLTRGLGLSNLEVRKIRQVMTE